MSKVIGPAFGDEPNVIGGLHELANRTDIKGFVIVMRLESGEYEHIRLGMNMVEHGYAVVVAQENSMKRIRDSITLDQAVP